jgi:hypothetical protein
MSTSTRTGIRMGRFAARSSNSIDRSLKQEKGGQLGRLFPFPVLAVTGKADLNLPLAAIEVSGAAARAAR